MIEAKITEEARFIERLGITRREYLIEKQKAEAILKAQADAYIELRKKYRAARDVYVAIAKEMEAMKQLPGARLEADDKSNPRELCKGQPGTHSTSPSGERRCGAKKKNGRPCTRLIPAGCQFCWLHEGFNPYSGDPEWRRYYRHMIAVHALIEAALVGKENHHAT